MRGDSDTADRSNKTNPSFEQSASDTHLGGAASRIGRRNLTTIPRKRAICPASPRSPRGLLIDLVHVVS